MLIGFIVNLNLNEFSTNICTQVIINHYNIFKQFLPMSYYDWYNV